VRRSVQYNAAAPVTAAPIAIVLSLFLLASACGSDDQTDVSTASDGDAQSELDNGVCFEEVAVSDEQANELRMVVSYSIPNDEIIGRRIVGLSTWGSPLPSRS